MKPVNPYSNLYHSGLEYLVLLNGSQCTVFFSILPLLEWNTNTVVLSTPVRAKLCKAVNMKSTSFNVLLSNLTRKNVLYKVRNNIYRVNPTLLWYGEEESRIKLVNSRDWSISKLLNNV